MFKRVVNFIQFKRLYSSALYITGEKAQKTFAVLIPHIDFEERLQQREELENNIAARGLNINLDQVVHLWNFYKNVRSQYLHLEDTRQEIANRIQKQNESVDSEEIERLKVHGKLVRDDMRVLKENLWDVDEKAAVKVLSLPNDLHHDTPRNAEKVVYINGKIPENVVFHLEIGHDLIEYHNPMYYFLKGEAAEFELAVQFYVSRYLKDLNFIPFSNYDFSRSIVVEGCGINYEDPGVVFTLGHTDDTTHENSRLHLTGSSSVISFMAYFTKHTVMSSLFPLKYYASGRKYQPVGNDHSLLNCSQESVIQVFIATKDDSEEMNSEFQNLLNNMVDIYKSLGYHFRVIYNPANRLLVSESLRATIEMYSSHLQKYVPVANLSIYDSYLSKRLRFNTGPGNKQFPKVISGTVLSVPKLLACVLENGSPLLTPDLRNHLY